ncbi:MAG: hypothetical protein USCAAHI_02075 [Beijerinckiaceae bacterium]|jgi:hypothetical protein|nr:MAG: hypothetical protein USCAAHI_02075 [Beijerinckiaceae bacterium]
MGAAALSRQKMAAARERLIVALDFTACGPGEPIGRPWSKACVEDCHDGVMTEPDPTSK